jgi:hypothetical protein
MAERSLLRGDALLVRFILLVRYDNACDRAGPVIVTCVTMSLVRYDNACDRAGPVIVTCVTMSLVRYDNACDRAGPVINLYSMYAQVTCLTIMATDSQTWTVAQDAIPLSKVPTYVNIHTHAKPSSMKSSKHNTFRQVLHTRGLPTPKRALHTQHLPTQYTTCVPISLSPPPSPPPPILASLPRVSTKASSRNARRRINNMGTFRV